MWSSEPEASVHALNIFLRVISQFLCKHFCSGSVEFYSSSATWHIVDFLHHSINVHFLRYIILLIWKECKYILGKWSLTFTLGTKCLSAQTTY